MYMITMTEEENQAYKWATSQGFQSIAARYAKVLAKYIERNAVATPATSTDEDKIDPSSVQVIRAEPGSTVTGVKQTIIK